MKVLGVFGCPHPRPRIAHAHTLTRELACGWFHDAAAALIEDGRVIAAVEEERLTRRKYEGRFPYAAIEFCLARAGLEHIDELDAIYFAEERGEREELPDYSAPRVTPDTVLGLVRERFTGTRPAEGFVFGVSHHQAHANAAYGLSGYDEALVLTYDGFGDFVATALWTGTEAGVELLSSQAPPGGSLGYFYSVPLKVLGYGYGDEYKVMGLAPYGDPRTYASLVEPFVGLREGGQLELDLAGLDRALSERFEPRARGDEFGQVHMDLAATIQAQFERASVHVLEHFRAETGLSHLCIGGGCGQNSTFNGKLAARGLFERIYVMPAATDAGNAIGAGLEAWAGRQMPERAQVRRCDWGPGLAEGEVLEAALERWSAFVSVERVADIEARAAEALARGGVLGWVQGQLEFGPRALGNRSILADPRPASNKDRINALIKKREFYRPFAPVVVEERVGDFFEHNGVLDSLPFMTATLRVHEDWADKLAAVTHVDRSARVQTVTAEQNPRLHRLLRAFGERTGVPILLNTSFNNNAEPIVSTPAEAIVCLLSSDLSDLVVGDYWLRKRDDWRARIGELRVSLRPDTQITCALPEGAENALRQLFNGRLVAELSPPTHLVLCAPAGQTLAETCAELGLDAEAQAEVERQILVLVERRLIQVSP